MATRYVLFTDVTDAELDNTPIQDGQVVFSYPSGRMFLDEGNSRFTVGGREADDMLSRVSERPVQNKVITNNIINTLTEAKAITKNDVFASTKVIKELAANSANIEDMTQEEYNQLSTEQKYDGTIRNITDAEVEYQHAGGVDYSNETSGLDAINVQDAIDEINNNVSNNICMNLIPFPYYSGSSTASGVTFTVNNDGTITANGTATADVYFNIDSRLDNLNITEEGQTYTLSGCPKGGGGSTYRIRYYEFASNKETVLYQRSDDGEGATFTSKNHAYTSILIFIADGQTVSDLVFKPMLEIGSVAHEYVQPISEPNSRINEVVASLDNNLGVKLISENVVNFASGYSGTSKLYRSGNTYMLEIGVSGNILAKDNTIGTLNSDTYKLPISTFGAGRYGTSGTSSVSASGILLPNKTIRIHGNNSTTGNFAECTFIYM